METFQVKISIYLALMSSYVIEILVSVAFQWFPRAGIENQTVVQKYRFQNDKHDDYYPITQSFKVNKSLMQVVIRI